MLLGVRPEEIADWQAARATMRLRSPPRSRFAASADAQAQAVERALDAAGASPRAAATPSC